MTEETRVVYSKGDFVSNGNGRDKKILLERKLNKYADTSFYNHLVIHLFFLLRQIYSFFPPYLNYNNSAPISKLLTILYSSKKMTS